MRNPFRSKVIRGGVFILILALMLTYVQAVITPKWRYDSEIIWIDSDTDRYGFFYKLPENTVDYFTIGASTSFYSVNPTRVYAETGITGYDLGSSGSGIALAYYMLREGLKTQHPQMVFIDVSMLTKSPETQPKSFLTQAITQMKPSFNKIEAVLTNCNNNRSALELLFPLLQFHDRWEELGESDFNLRITPDYSQSGAVSPFSQVMATSILDRPAGSIYTLRDGTVSVREDAAEINKESAAYFEKMLALCEENRIEVIPTHFASIWEGGKDEVIKGYLGTIGLELLDLTDPAVGLDWAQDTIDSGTHTNFWGSAKVSAYLADYLQEKGLQDHRGQSGYELWDETLEKYKAWEQEELRDRKIIDAYDYLNKLAAIKDEYLIVITVQNEATFSWNNTLEAAVHRIGVKSSFFGQLQQSFVAIIDQGNNVFEQWDGRAIKVNTSFQLSDGQSHALRVVSEGFPYGYNCSCSVLIDAKEQSCQLRGLNIVVIDKVYGEVVSSVAIDSYALDLTLKEKKLPKAQTENWTQSTESLQLVDDGVYNILYSGDPTYAVDVSNGTTDENANIWLCERSGLQMGFEFSYIGDGLYTVRAVCSDKYLTVENMGNTAGRNVAQESYTGLANQKWFLTMNENGSYSFRSLYNGKAMNVADGIAATGVNIQIWPENNQIPQQFYLERVS